MTDQTVKSMSNGVQMISYTDTYQVNRGGWCGAWDALIAAITRSNRRTVNTPLTFSVMVQQPEQLAAARNDALEEAGLYHGTEVKKLQNAIFTLILGQREQPLRDAIEHHEISATGIRALKTPTPTEDET